MRSVVPIGPKIWTIVLVDNSHFYPSIQVIHVISVDAFIDLANGFVLARRWPANATESNNLFTILASSDHLSISQFYLPFAVVSLRSFL